LNLILNSACRVWTPIDSDTVNSKTKVCNNMIEENRRKSKNPWFGLQDFKADTVPLIVT
jgi:hypothetical protein